MSRMTQYDRDVAEWDRQRLRDAICGDATGDEAYRLLIEFDINLCSEHEGFKAACDRVGLPYLTARKWKKLFDEMD